MSPIPLDVIAIGTGPLSLLCERVKRHEDVVELGLEGGEVGFEGGGSLFASGVVVSYGLPRRYLPPALSGLGEEKVKKQGE